MHNQKQKASREAQNNAHYQSSKERQDRALLRLDKGALRALDDARGRLGLSRSAFVQMFLLPLAEALSIRWQLLQASSDFQRKGLGTFLTQAIDARLNAIHPAEASAVSDEFGRLFDTEV